MSQPCSGSQGIDKDQNNLSFKNMIIESSDRNDKIENQNIIPDEKTKIKPIYIVLFTVFAVLITLIIISPFVYMYINYLDSRNNKPRKETFIFNANLSFALNINNNGSFSEHIYKAFDKIPRKQRDIYKNYPLIKYYNSKAQIEVSKKTILTDEIKDNLIDNKNNNNKIYVLISYVVQKLEVTIENKTQIKVKDYYQNLFKDIEKSNATDKIKRYKNITDQIGFYIPNEVILGGRIDLSFELNEKYNITFLNSVKNQIFNPTSNSLLKLFENFTDYSCNVIGGEIKTFCKDKNFTKWYDSLTDNNLEIILYNNLQTIGDFLDNDLRKSFRKFFYNKTINYTDGIYHGDIRNKSRNGYGIFEYNNGYIYLGEWKDDKREGEHGILEDNKNIIYNGDWKNDKKEGYGISYEKGKEKYNGEWKNDLYDGKGIIYFDKNDWIEAKFKKGKCKEILNNYSNWKKIKCSFDLF